MSIQRQQHPQADNYDNHVSLGLDRLIDFEDGLLDTDEEIALFQDLVTTGLAWRLQGFYGRTAANFLERGLIFEPGDEVADCEFAYAA